MTSSTGFRDNWSLRGTAILFLPFLLATLGYLWLWEKRWDVAREAHETRIRGTLAMLAADANPEAYFRGVMQHLEARMFRKGVPRSAQKALLNSLKQRFPGTFRITVVDSSGEQVAELCDELGPRTAWKRLLVAYQKLLKGDSEPIVALKPIVKTLLGGFVPVGRKLHGYLMRADQNPERGWVYLTNPSDLGWMAVTFAQHDDWPALPLRDMVKRLNRPGTELQMTLLENPVLSSLQNRDFASGPLGIPPLAELAKTLRPGVWSGEIFWSAKAVRSHLSLVAGMNCRAFSHLRQERARMGLLLAFSWILLALGARFGGGSWFQFQSIRTRMVVALLYSAGLPLATIGVVTWVFVGEHRLQLERDQHSRILEALQGFDLMSPEALQENLNQWSRACLKLTWPKDCPELWKEQFLRLGDGLPWDVIRVYSPGGKCVFTETSGNEMLWNLEDFGFFEQVARNILEKIFVEESPSARLAGKKNFMGMGFQGTVLDGAFSNMASKMGLAGEYTAGQESTFMTILPLMDGRNMVANLMLAVWNRKRSEDEFIRKNMLDFARELEDCRLLAWSPNDQTRRYPANSPFWKVLERHFSRIRTHPAGYQETVNAEGGIFLLTSVRAEQLKGIFLISLTSDLGIRRVLAKTIWWVSGLGVLLALASATATWIFATAFLIPVTTLAQGVRRLNSRDFSVRLVGAAQDELGQLISAFNEMAEGLNDLEVARGLQETLFARAPLAMPGMTLFGLSSSPGRLGGNFHDFSLVQTEEASFILGACSDSGVRSALVLSLAKGVLAHPASPADPKLALPVLETVKEGVLGSGFPLEIAFGRVHCRDGDARILVKGLLPPLMISRNGSSEVFPLERISQETLYYQEVLNIPPGALVLLGTRSILGWERERPSDDSLLVSLKEQTARLCRENFLETEKAVREWFLSKVAANEGLGISVLVLYRHAKEGAE